MTDMTPGPVVEAATPGSGGAGVRESGEGSKTPVPPRPRLLDLFCCEGGAGAGYARAGFDVVGVDVEPQPRYPFRFVQADALTYLLEHGGEYDAIHASPPCQGYSRSRHVTGRQYGGLIDEVREILDAIGVPYIIENTLGAPLPSAITLCGTTFGLGLHRHRLFDSPMFLMGEPCDPSRVVYRGREAEIFGHHGNTTRIRDEWGVPWMSQYGIAQCVPPAFTEYLGAQLLANLSVPA